MQGLEGGGDARELDVYSDPCNPFLVHSSRLKLLAKQTVNPGAGMRKGVCVGGRQGVDVDWGRLFTSW